MCVHPANDRNEAMIKIPQKAHNKINFGFKKKKNLKNSIFSANGEFLATQIEFIDFGVCVIVWFWLSFIFRCLSTWFDYSNVL